MKMYHTFIIGAGVTGLASAMYAGRLQLKTIVFGAESGTELPIGGVITLTDTVENYPGFIKLTGQELAENIEKHAKEYKIEMKEEKVLKIEKKKDYFKAVTDNGTYRSLTIIFATGAKWNKLEMKGATQFENKGVHYCALCDGALFKNKTVAVIGGSDTAAKEAILLAAYAKKVFIIYRGEKIRPEPVNGQLIKDNNRIDVILNTNVIEIKGSKLVTGVVLDRIYKKKMEITLDGVFGAIGHTPLSELAKPLGVKTNNKGEIIINHKDSTTNIPGIFAAGDVADKTFKQAITGVSEGVTAAHSAYSYIKDHQVKTF